MAAPIEFYLDFSSPYSYLASESIEPLAARYGRSVDYKPMLLGVAFKVSGMRPLPDVPLGQVPLQPSDFFGATERSEAGRSKYCLRYKAGGRFAGAS